MAWRELEEQVLHDRVINALKKTMFDFPNDKYPYLKTHTNHPIKTHGVPNHTGGQYYPDLVVLDTRTEKVVTVVEVETINTVNESEAAQWLKFATLGERFYLFFPRGLEIKVKELCQKIANAYCYEYWHDGKTLRVEHIKF
ncbi:MAG: hypothetical protein ABIK93_07915 [candidate division WOR-3 bacterium]